MAAIFSGFKTRISGADRVGGGLIIMQNNLSRRAINSPFKYLLLFHFLWLAIRVLISGSAAAETPEGFRLGYNAMISYPSIREDLLVPLVFRGPGAGIGISSEWNGNHWSIDADADLEIGYVLNRFGHDGVVMRPALRFGAVRELWGSTAVGTFSAGIPVQLNINDAVLFSWDDAHLYWMTAHWTGLAFRWNRSLGPTWNMRCDLQTPLLAFCSRPPAYRLNKQDAGAGDIGFFLSKPNHELFFAGPDTYRGVNLFLSSEKSLRRSTLSLYAGYRYAIWTEQKSGQVSNIVIGAAQRWRLGK